MDHSPNLSLPYLAAAQAQKHVTHNEALRVLDAVVQVGVLSRALTAPPGSPENGDRYLIAADPTGDWTGHADALAAFQDGAWLIYPPKPGWLVWIADEAALVAWDGSAWVVAGGGSINPATHVGVNATADDTNRLSVKSDAALFSHDDVTPGSGDHRIVVNKSAAAKTASVVFQDGFSGRAEFGLAGDDNWHVKVSPDGSTWFEALVVDRTTGRVYLPLTPWRELLTANRSIYFANAGSDTTGDGSFGNPFASAQKCFDFMRATFDLAGYQVTIQGINETTTAGLLVRDWVGGGVVVLDCAGGTISTTAASCISTTGVLPGVFQYRNLRLETTTSGHCVSHSATGSVYQGTGVTFGNCAWTHLLAAGPAAFVSLLNPYTLDGGAQNHMLVNAMGAQLFANVAVTVTKGKKTFTSSFLTAYRPVYVAATGSYSGPTCTISSANPGVVTLTAHGLSANDPVNFGTTGTLPGGGTLTPRTAYFVKTVLDPDTFTVSATAGGTAIDTTGGAGSGTHNVLSVSAKRHSVALNGSVETINGATQFPGHIAGTVATEGILTP